MLFSSLNLRGISIVQPDWLITADDTGSPKTEDANELAGKSQMKKKIILKETKRKIYQINK